LDDGGGFGLQTGLAFFISCDEVSNGTVQVDRADSTPNARTFTDVNTTPSVVASAGAPYTNQCLPASANLERLIRANDAGLQIGGGDGWSAAIWIERLDSSATQQVVFGRHDATDITLMSFAIYLNATATVGGIVSSGVTLGAFANIATNLSKRTLLVLEKATGSGVATLYSRAFDGSWVSQSSGTLGQTNAGTVATSIGSNAVGLFPVINSRLGPAMYWPTRLLTSDDRDNLFNDGNGLTYGQM
jgi:hypothetical protein